MNNSTKSAVAPRYRPKISDKECIWKLPVEFRENEGLAILGLFKNSITRKDIKICKIDLGLVEWADPLPLLYLGLIIAESEISREKIIVNLGSLNKTHSTQSHRIFLKFFAEQDFLVALSEHVIFRLEGKLEKDVTELKYRLISEPQSTHILNASCISAKLIRVDEFRDNQELLQQKVESLVLEAKERSIFSAFGAEPLARDILFQKFRKLLYELILNVAEHSSLNKDVVYAGVYARIREPKPPIEENATTWAKLFDETKNIFGQKHFRPNPYTEWAELYICDIGDGLTSQIDKWKVEDDPELEKDLQTAKKSKNPLQSIALRLFRKPLSRHARHDVNRTAVTGLQHLGHILTIGGDYCRIYTQKGCWIGDHLPLSNSYSRKDIRDKRVEPKFAELVPVSGTAYAFSIQPNHQNLSEEQTPWTYPNNHERSTIVNELITQAAHSENDDVEYFDRQSSRNCVPPNIGDLSPTPPKVMVLRPPRLTNKIDISKWLVLVAGDPSRPPLRNVNELLMVDLSPFQLLTFRELLLNVQINDGAKLDIFLVSENWAVTCLESIKGSRKFTENRAKAAQFFSENTRRSFSARELAVLLRQMDSEVFWKPAEENEQEPFFNKPIIWTRSKDDGKSITLQRYLDFPRALSNPQRYRACRHALRRCLALYPAYQAVPADNLVVTLVKDAILSAYTKEVKTEKNLLIIGSVAVTSGTVDEQKKSTSNESMHILIHSESPNTQRPKVLSALLWVSQLQKENQLLKVEKSSNNKPWRRIPNTPYIAPLGEQSISILRYKRKSDGSLNFEDPIYERTPENTYKDFQRLGILKAGHWRYGSRHDLLTINMKLAFRFSFLELGPLYNWLRSEFKKLFSIEGTSQRAEAQLLIYPSHSVTDILIDRIRQDPGFEGLLPEGGMVPVKFLGMHTVSPLLASHLVAYQIREQVSRLGWKTWKSVVLDDGTITGKHLRELTQFLQGLGAQGVYTIAFLDRTGLPAQELVFERFFERHKRFWRWDVPPLGNKRDCPLCQALSIAQTYAHRLPSDRQKNRLEMWTDILQVRDVDTEWHHGGIQSRRLSPPLKITFGVDENSEGHRKEKSLAIDNSTTATSLLLELTCLTTRSDVAIKKAKQIENYNPEASLEIVSCQLLLFLDELGHKEKLNRYIFILETICSQTISTDVTALCGLCFTLADHELIKELWKHLAENILKKKRIKNLDAIITINIINSRYTFITKEKYVIRNDANEIERDNYILSGGATGLHRIVHHFLETLYRNPTKPDRRNAHTTEIRTRLINLKNLNTSISLEIILDRIKEVFHDMKLVEQIFLDLQNELIVKSSVEYMAVFTSQINQLEILTNILSSKIDEKSTIHQIISLTNIILNSLYGRQQRVSENEEGLLEIIGNQLFKYFQSNKDIDNGFVAKQSRSIRRRWPDILAAKAASKKNEQAMSRWSDDNGNIIYPEILCSEGEKIDEIWLYCDTYISHIIEDTLSNVFHASCLVFDPWDIDSVQKEGTHKKAHLWWRIEKNKNYVNLKTANASENQMVSLQQTVNIAGLERSGGSIQVDIKENRYEQNVVYTTLRLPLAVSFIKEEL
jgi:hypothetical protein